LIENAKQNLSITGLYRTSEKDINAGFYKNIGFVRAIELEALFKAKGIEDSRIDIKESKMIKGEDLLEPAYFDLSNGSENPDGYEKLQFNFYDMTYSSDAINFDIDSDKFVADQSFNSYADSVKTYLGENTDKVLTIIGHTDYTGSDDHNDKLGLRRAKSVQQHLVAKQGIPIEKIKTDTRGKRNPIAPNDIEDNRRKNRRVQFMLDK